jgi:hypothetical protein
MSKKVRARGIQRDAIDPEMAAVALWIQAKRVARDRRENEARARAKRRERENE